MLKKMLNSFKFFAVSSISLVSLFISSCSIGTHCQVLIYESKMPQELEESLKK